jgi:hypothetical protein
MIATAVVGLAGVVIGGSITGTTQWLLARRRDRYERRSAVRLLCTDFYKTQAMIASVRDTGEWGPEKGPLPTDAFDRYAGTLAASLNQEAWTQVEGAILGVRRLEGIRQESHADGRALMPQELEDFARIGAWLDATLATLRERGRLTR